MTGIEAFLEVLHRAGVRRIFGNPGTTELPLQDALGADARFAYTLGVHEIAVVGMADGFAQASGQPAVANVHICCGLGNAMGMLYNAHVAGSPVILTAGQQDRRLLLGDPVLSGDMVSVARPWTKWSHDVQRLEDIPIAARRAIQTALAPPTGPVFLSLPLDLQMATGEAWDLTSPSVIDRQIRPPQQPVKQAATLLLNAQRPAILAGSRVTESGAIEALVKLAERLGAPVFSECATAHGRLPFPCDHPQYGGALPLWSPEIRERLAPYDVVLAVGLNVLRSYLYHEPVAEIPEHIQLIQLDNVPGQLSKNYPAAVALLADPHAGLIDLDAELAPGDSAGYRTLARARREALASARRQMQHDLRANIASLADVRPMAPAALMGAIAEALPANVAVIEEAVTTTGWVLQKLGAIRDPSGYFAHRGWALGWGIGCAIGVKLAWPERPVLAIIGDGAALYGMQGLWTAAHYNLPVTFVICHNAQYKILKNCGDVMPLERLKAGQHVGLDVTGPVVDFVVLAKSLGVEAERVESPGQLREAVAASLAGNRPRLIEAPIGA